jgi:hypothetical protein
MRHIWPARILSRRVASGTCAIVAALLCLTAIRADQSISKQPLAWLVGRWTGKQASHGLELIWTESPTGLRGYLDEVAAGSERKNRTTYELAPANNGWSLLLNEGGRSLRFQGVLESKQQLRFERRISKTGPFIVEIGIEGDQLIIRALRGPQHGAAVPKEMWFERAGGSDTGR